MSLVFETALKEFKAGLTQEEKDDFKTTDLGTLKRELSKVQKDQENRRSMMYMRRLEPFLTAMENYGKVIEVFLNTSDVLAFVWGPMKFILQTTSTYSEALNRVLDAYQSIGEEIPLLVDFELFAANPHLRQVLGMIYKDILDFHMEAVRYFRKSFWKKLFMATWTGFVKKITHLVSNLKEHKRLIESRATIMQLQETIAIRKRVEAGFSDELKAEQDRQRDEAKAWLSGFDNSGEQSRYREARICPGSGEWLLNDNKFENWHSFDFCTTPLLWLTGIPGAGKTILASVVIDQLIQESTASDVTVAYFYCKYGDKQRNSFLSIARSLISQLIVECPEVVPQLYQERCISSGPALASTDLAEKLLEVMITTAMQRKTVYLVLDGLDECGKEDFKRTATWVQEFSDSLPVNEKMMFRCLFVSQDDGLARNSFSQTSQLKITHTDTEKDIEAFSEHWHQKIEDRVGKLSAREHNIARIVTAMSQGMFLFAKLVVEYLADLPSRDDVLSEISPDHFPLKLNEVYARIMARMTQGRSETTQKTVKKVLGWVACAPRPLRWREIQCAISIDLDKEANNDGKRLVEEPKSLFSSFIELQANGMVDVVHGTARHYLISSDYIVPKDVHRSITVLTMSYLGFSYLGMPELGKAHTQENIQDELLHGLYGLLDYASACWEIHLQGSFDRSREGLDQDSQDELTEAIDVFVDSHWCDTSKKLPVSVSIKKLLFHLSDCESQDKVAQAVAWAKRQLGVNGQAPSDDEALDIWKRVARIREALESLSISPTAKDKQQSLGRYYGQKHFKCPRISCYYYHEGFSTERDRNNHIDKHERPFLCVVSGCLKATFGYSSKAELTRHVFEQHGLDFDDDWDFPVIEETSDNPDTPSQQTGKFLCPECGKSFTRRHTLKLHAKKHSGEVDKPYACYQCGLAFARNNDRRRHERQHGSENKLLCFGTLDDGTEWGCKAEFTRRDKREDHFRSKKGQQCIMPFAKQKLLQDAEAGSQGDTNNSLVYNGDVMLPKFKDFLILCGLQSDLGDNQ